MDVDSLLNYESECYQSGLEHGKSVGWSQGHTEGRELGIQTGFQKFLAMGVLQARAAHWRAECNLGKVDHRHELVLKAINQAVDSPVLDNSLEGVEEFDRRLKLAKNKCRTLASATKSPTINAHEQKIMYQRASEDGGAIEDMY